MPSKDLYPDLDTLKARYRRWQHYNIRIFDMLSDVTIVSPHGGFIEAGTSHIAQLVAGRNYNFFDFQGLLKTRPLDLHITSVNFREPLLAEVLGRSRLAVSIHCMGKEAPGEIWVGGLNRKLRDCMAKALREKGFTVRTDLPRYKGVHPRNFVNMPVEHGVQLEIAGDVVDSFFSTPAKFAREVDFAPETTPVLHSFVAACRKALCQCS
ncbi:MAG: poly-gamma-glutamate hydrolase family protein [Candidatus Obscuribacter sp.]|nr:poly-gamma-glutamate hydrolase family protein [Candidatus Obscuribacter sp.]